MDPKQYLEETLESFLSLYASLSGEEILRAGPEGAWSAAEFVEHLATAERGIGILLKRGLSGEKASEESLAATQGKTEVILGRVAVSASRVEAPEMTRPVGKYGAWPGALAALQEARKNSLTLAEEEGLDQVVAPHPALGPMTGTQWLLFCAAHMERHRKQMAERFGR